MSDPTGPDWRGYEPSGRRMDEVAEELADTSLVGQTGEVVLAIGGGDRPGEVVIHHRGIPEMFIAYADEPIDRGVEVRVTSVRGPRQVGVTTTTA